MTPLELSKVTLQVVASPMIAILTTPEVSFTLLENIYSMVISLYDHHIFIVQATGHLV
jgi:hypothetical protein